MNILVMGSGLIGAQRIQALTKLAPVASIAVYDPKLNEGVSLAPKAKSVGLEAALGRTYDAAVVATPHDIAVELIPQVARVAPALLIEKPLGRTLAEAERLVAAAGESASKIFLGLNYRFLKHVQHVKRLLQTGELGRVLAVDAVLSHGAQPGYDKSWKTDAVKCGGGVCIDPGIHLFDLLCWFFGGAELSGGLLTRTFWPIQVEDHANLILSLPGGAPASIFLSLSSWQSRMEMTIETENAQLLLRGRGKFYGPQQLTVALRWPWLQAAHPRETGYNYGLDDNSLGDETGAFLEALQTGKSSGVAEAEDALRAMKIVDDCYSKLPFAGK